MKCSIKFGLASLNGTFHLSQHNKTVPYVTCKFAPINANNFHTNHRLCNILPI